MVGGDKNNDDGEAVAHKRAKYIIKSPKFCKIFEHKLHFALGPRNSIEVVVFLEKTFLKVIFEYQFHLFGKVYFCFVPNAPFISNNELLDAPCSSTVVV